MIAKCKLSFLGTKARENFVLDCRELENYEENCRKEIITKKQKPEQRFSFTPLRIIFVQ